MLQVIILRILLLLVVCQVLLAMHHMLLVKLDSSRRFSTRNITLIVFGWVPLLPVGLLERTLGGENSLRLTEEKVYLTLTRGWRQQRCESREMRCRWNQKRKTRNTNERRSYQKNLNRIQDTGYGHTTHNISGTHRCLNLETLREITDDVFRPALPTPLAVRRLTQLAGPQPPHDCIGQKSASTMCGCTYGCATLILINTETERTSIYTVACSIA